MNTVAIFDGEENPENPARVRLQRWLMAAFWVVLAMVLVAGSAYAAKDPDGKADQLVAFDFRIAGDEIRTRVVIEFEQKPEFSFHLLATPHRVVVDLPETVFGFEETAASARGLLSDVRYGAMAPGRSRMVFTSIGPVKVIMADVMESKSDGTYRLVLDLAATSNEEFASLIGLQSWDSVDAQPDDGAALNPAVGNGRFTVALDPGHGGIDTGAKGKGGAF